MSSAKPTRQKADLADVLELILDKGIVINADIAITVGQTEMIGIELRAAIASFETAAEYGLAFPSGTDMRRVEQASGRESLHEDDGVDLGIAASASGEGQGSTHDPPSKRPQPSIPFVLGEDDDEAEESESEADDEDGGAEDTDGSESDGEQQSEETAETQESESEES